LRESDREVPRIEGAVNYDNFGQYYTINSGVYFSKPHIMTWNPNWHMELVN